MTDEKQLLAQAYDLAEVLTTAYEQYRAKGFGDGRLDALDEAIMSFGACVGLLKQTGASSETLTTIQQLLPPSLRERIQSPFL